MEVPFKSIGNHSPLQAMIRITTLLSLLLSSSALSAQMDEQVAYVPSSTVRHGSEHVRMGFNEGAIPGTVEFQMPDGTHRIDLLNGRGKVERILTGHELHNLDLGGLRCGTWTLRAHTSEGLNVRRFVVMERGRIAWAVPSPRRKP